LVSCNNAFCADPDTFCLHDKHVSYALSYLCGSTQRHFDTQLEDKDEVDFIPPGWLHNWPRFVEELREMFGDPNAEATTEAELDGLHMQTNQKFADFLVDFNTLSSQVNWGDRTLCHRLKQVLPDCIKDSLALVEEPAAFNKWKRLVQNVDQWYWEQQAEICWDARPNPGTNTSCGTPVPNMCNTVSVAPATSVMSTARGPPSNSPIACHLTTKGGLTQTERDRRIAQGLCLYCGGQGHKASE
jgi:Retrotransposon gag protein